MSKKPTTAETIALLIKRIDELEKKLAEVAARSETHVHNHYYTSYTTPVYPQPNTWEPIKVWCSGTTLGTAQGGGYATGTGGLGDGSLTSAAFTARSDANGRLNGVVYSS